MATFLLSWNPSKWAWKDLSDVSSRTKNGEIVLDEWSCGVTKKIGKGDKFLLVKLGNDSTSNNVKGIFASGKILSSPKKRQHWDKEKRDVGKMGLFVDIKYDILLNPYSEEILSHEALPKNFHWFPQASGVEIPEDVLRKTMQIWSDFLDSAILIPEEIIESDSQRLFEGAKKTIEVNAYERNPEARRICIEHYQAKCFVCGFEFNSFYGESVAESYIHVHHLKELSTIGSEYEVNPIEDLRPVCPNCHAIIHKARPAYSIEQLNEFIETQRKLNDNRH